MSDVKVRGGFRLGASGMVAAAMSGPNSEKASEIQRVRIIEEITGVYFCAKAWEGMWV